MTSYKKKHALPLFHYITSAGNWVESLWINQFHYFKLLRAAFHAVNGRILCQMFIPIVTKQIGWKAIRSFCPNDETIMCTLSFIFLYFSLLYYFVNSNVMILHDLNSGIIALILSVTKTIEFEISLYVFQL